MVLSLLDKRAPSGIIQKKKYTENVRRKGLAGMTENINAYWNVTLCSLADRWQHFRATCCLHLRGTTAGPLEHWYVPAPK